jgi:translocation and assembly module TamA
MHRPARWLVGVLAVVFAAPGVRAADPQPYSVTIAPTKIAPLDRELKASSQLLTLRQSAAISPFALIGRARLDVERWTTVLESLGYYQGRVRITMLGKALDESELPDLLADFPEGQTAPIVIAVEPGPLYHLRRIVVEGEVSADERAAMKLEPGAPAGAAAVLDARAHLQQVLLEHGYAFAQVEPPVAEEDPAEKVLDVSFRVSRGERANVGAVTIVGLQRVNAALVRDRLSIVTGEPFRQSRIEKSRRDLLALGVFSSVAIRTADQPDAEGRVPLTVTVQERLRHSLAFNTAYSSDLGGSVGVKWSDRDVSGAAEQLNLSAELIEFGGHATTGTGYNLAAQFVKPNYLAQDQSVQFNVGALKQSLQAYDQTAFTASTVLARRLSPLWAVSVGVSGEQEKVTQEGMQRDYTLLGLPLAAKYNSTGLLNPLQDALRGARASLSVTPTRSLAGLGATFVVAQADAATYFDLAKLGLASPGRSVFALRALVGQVHGAAPFDLPPDQRFYGGGSGTVRGFRYQSVGPSFADGKPTGGNAIDAATVEFRQRFADQFGGAVFVDAGQVSGDGHVFQGRPSIGIGFGVRYYTPIGPIRLDVALPASSRLPGGDRFELYVGLGQVF